ncbi:MAG: hypothetical protein IJU45_04315 [Clostridia bacterium]|nr:hypothetical protein [Clostridia bacterium]
MKKTVAAAMIFILMLTAFTACKKNNVITDYQGHEHTLVMKKGEYVQDEFGNLVEKVTDENGKKQTNIISFPDVIQRKSNQIENAYFKLTVPAGWKFDEEIRKFRIQHDGECTKSGAVCEVYTEVNSTGDVENDYATKLARDKGVAFLGSDMVSDIKETEEKLFGIECKAFSSRYNDNCTHYCYVFGYAHVSIAVQMLINDECKDEDFDPVSFIEKYFTLKDLG